MCSQHAHHKIPDTNKASVHALQSFILSASSFAYYDTELMYVYSNNGGS